MGTASSTSEGTAGYARKFPDFVQAGHYRDFRGLAVSSLGLGTYLGKQDEGDDRLYVEAVKAALSSGVNLLDTAINYRCMRSERNIGRAIRELAAEGKITREEVVVCTKGGFIPFDGNPPSDPRAYFEAEYLKPGLCAPGEVAADCHCMAPPYLRNQVERSLKNLDLECIDLYYVHNPETQFEALDRAGFYAALEKAFRELENLVSEGKIRAYGTATWNGYRVGAESPDYLSLNEVLKAAEKAGGSGHHFKAVQLPYNLAMAEAIALDNQVLGSQTVSLLQAAHANDLAVFTSASILQSRLSRNLPPVIQEVFTGLETDAQRAIQFVRSSPGVTAALVGMKHKEHVEENLKTASVPPVSPEKLKSLFEEKG
jgi:aryl-alcohol dehydrogenase-like predicted oxidoreductase